jgi:hypothetical protein
LVVFGDQTLGSSESAEGGFIGELEAVHGVIASGPGAWS